MKIIYRPRGKGKTTELIKLASEGRYKLIICPSRDESQRIFRLAQELKMKIPFPITYREFLAGQYALGRNIEELLIDNVELFLQYLTPIKIGAISITKEVVQKPYKEKSEED
ncbi:MAG: hypothetical protein DDT19_00075 [Syntrophomonadaceae bacterium]|nr:hypothetical protein [Bacillota bacterium]